MIIRQILLALSLSLVTAATCAAVHYKIDTKGAHAFITFKIKHLGYSWLLGRFNRFDGEFYYDHFKPDNNRVEVTIDMNSLDTNHAERDKHLRSARFFDVKKYPKARFVSTAYQRIDNDQAKLTGKLTLRGITKTIDIDLEHVGNGPDPWGGYRRGFEGSTTLQLSDWKMKEAGILGPSAEEIEIYFSIEGIRQ